MAETCTPHHDWFTDALTFGLCCGLIVSYAPQHFRIINKRSSEGLDPLFLLLGCTSSAAGFLNMVTLQWSMVRCCRVLSLGTCIEITAGIVQLGLQWILFNSVLVLYMIYYPPHLKFKQANVVTTDTQPLLRHKVPAMSSEWRTSIIVSWLVVIHLIFVTFTTFVLLGISRPLVPGAPLPHNISSWATFLGVTSAILAAIQYVPQLQHTYRTKLVGALSIPMMCIQTPGALLMVLSIALRPGTNWTSWITFAVAGLMQGSLLVMCILWTFRQRRLGIDEFGNSIVPETAQVDIPGLVVREGGSGPAVIPSALSSSLESSTEADIRFDAPLDAEESHAGEETPLLPAKAPDSTSAGRRRWFSWLRRT